MKNCLRKAFLLALAAAVLTCSFAVNAYAGTLKVGTISYPYGKILDRAIPILAQQGVQVEYVGYADDGSEGTQAALDLLEGRLDAHFLQTEHEFRAFADEHQLPLTVGAKVFVEPMGIYSKEFNSVEAAWDGAMIMLPQNGYMGRALWLLQDACILTLKSGAAAYCDTDSIADMNRPFRIYENDYADVKSVYENSNMSVLTAQQAQGLGLNPYADSLYREGPASAFCGCVGVRNGEENSEDIKKLLNVLQSEEISQFIYDNFGGAVVSVF